MSASEAFVAKGDEEVGGARGQRRVGVERDVRARKHGRAGLRDDERQLQPAFGRIERRRGERSLVVRGERIARFGNGPRPAVHDARLINVAGGGKWRELSGGDPVGGVEHAVEDGAVVLPEALPPAQAFDAQDVVELEVEVTSRYQHVRHSVEPGL
jgi:hypothetical protein